MSERSVAATLKELSTSIPWGQAADWDVSGLTLGDPDQPVRTAGVCHEVTREVVNTVATEPVDLLFTYHPLLFRPVRKLRAGTGPEGMAFQLVRMGVSLAVAHTAFDVCKGGAADALAATLGLGEINGFGAMEMESQVKVVAFVPARYAEKVAGAMAAVGAGQIGKYRGCSYRSDGIGAFLPQPGAEPVLGEVGEDNRVSEVRLEMIAPSSRKEAVVAALVGSHPYEEPAFDLYPVSANLPMAGRAGTLPEAVLGMEFADRVAKLLEVAAVRCTGLGERIVKRVAVLPGSGGSFIPAAVSAGVDAVVTGDVSHHQMAQADQLGVGVIDPGHAATEAPGIGKLLEMVNRVVPRTIDLTGLRTGPRIWTRR
jgi:dinuclear metal center YbgI/SA1388 family protein